ncbi:MAG: hypothetical protein A3F74_26025 [Betaproteobacteria bacterium RIFCSPLOWO2_12_FULL_62_58]|nr:MAG: hypothetical protein A3F74_26025 [Betaproteobacteria bacterium RIFCSPLOWO2_12_FULL_62_58]
MQVINVKSALRDYQVHITETTDFIRDLGNIKERLYVIDSNVWEIYREQIFRGIDPSKVMVLPIHEDRKNLYTVMEVYDELMSRAAKRNMTLISIGGGIVQDITGFAASTLYRGLNWLYVPTTLLAQADSCIGSKTSLNYKNYKNLVGTFFPPNSIYLHPSFLKTLRDEDFYSGLGEVIKLHLIGGADHVKSLLARIDQVRERQPNALLDAISGSLNVKLGFLDDEFDRGKRNFLNFGHCFGHALEATSNFAIPHGQAVMTGMVFANIVAKNRRFMSKNFFAELNEKILLDNIVSRPTQDHLNMEHIYSAMKMDKKRIGDGLTLIMQGDGYKMTKITDLFHPELEKSIDELKEVIGVI